MGCWNNTDVKMAKMWKWNGTRFTAEDLLHVTVPFGSVVSVQVIVNDGSTYGLVAFSNADNAAKALRSLLTTTDFIVSQDYENNTSKVSGGRPASVLRDRLRNMPPQSKRWGLVLRPACLLERPHPPAVYGKSVIIQISNFPKAASEVCHVLSHLSPSTISVKMDKSRALVKLPDMLTALWNIDLLNGLYTGNKRLQASIAVL